MKISIWIKTLVLAMMASTAGFADVIVTLGSNGELWKANAADVNGTKSLLATLTGGEGYIDSAFDGTYIYGLRNDGTVNRSDLSGNVSAVPLIGWSSRIKYINADSGTLYGMNNSLTANILDVGGNVAVNVTSTSAAWADFTVTDDGRFWLLLTNGDGASTTWAYGVPDGFSGTFGEQTGYVNFGLKLGYALDSAGNELYAAYDNGGNDGISRSTGGATNNTVFLVNVSTGLADIATGTDFYAANADGTIQSAPLTSRSAEETLGTLGSNVVGLEVVPEPGDSKR